MAEAKAHRRTGTVEGISEGSTSPANLRELGVPIAVLAIVIALITPHARLRCSIS